MAEKVIDIPGVGPTAFPDSMSEQEINAAATRAYQDANPGKKQPPVKSWVDTAVNAIPSVMGTAGAITGGIGGTAYGLGFGGVPGAAGGAALGTATGEAAKQLINRARGAEVPATSGEAAADIAIPATIAGVSTGVIGVGTNLARPYVGAALQKVGGLMESPKTVRQLAGQGVAAAGRAIDAAQSTPAPKMVLNATDIGRIRQLMSVGVPQGEATRQVWNLKIQAIVQGWKP